MKLSWKKTTALLGTALIAASMAFTALLEDTGERYLIAAASGCGSEHLSGTRHGLDDGGLCSWTLSNRTPLRIDDVNTDMRARRRHPTT